MYKFEITSNDKHVCFIAETSKRKAIEAVKVAQKQKVGALYKKIQDIDAGTMNYINHGRI